VAEADASQRVHQAGRRPRAALAAGYVYLATDGTQQPLFSGWSGAWTAGVQVSWSPFELRRSGAASAEAEARSQALRRQLEDLEQRVRLDVTTRILDHRTAHATHAVAQRALQAARENLRVTNDRYRQGVSSSSDLLDAEVALLRAGYDATDTAVSVRLSAAGLDRAVGR
jgi:outer membrane protein TolC